MLDRNGYAPSIIQDDLSKCFLCWRTTGKLDRHEPFGGAFRQKSKRYGMWLMLCHYPCHMKIEASTNRKLKKIAQRRAMEVYGWTKKDFIQEFGKNYV